MSDRRKFLQQSASVAGITWLGYRGYVDLFQSKSPPHSRNDAPSPSSSSTGPHPDGPMDRLGPVEASYYTTDGFTLTCDLCPHRCRLREGVYGVCRTRVARGGVLYTEGYGNLCAMNLDPIEKKPLYHFLPETRALSIAMGGCNLRCPNCQNWEISQARPAEVARFDVSPNKLSEMAKARAAVSVAYTYTEPVVTFEYVRDAARVARDHGVRNVLVSAGLILEKPLRELASWLDAATIDVKSFDPEVYRRFNRGMLSTVLRTLEVLRERGVWLEVSYLLVTGVTDAPAQVGKLAAWMVKHVGPDTPLHLLRFHPAFRMKTLPPTPLQNMTDAWKEAKNAGLHYVYLGNTPGDQGSDTVCPHDGQVLIRRRGFQVIDNRLVGGKCPACGRPVAGVFEG